MWRNPNLQQQKPLCTLSCKQRAARPSHCHALMLHLDIQNTRTDTSFGSVLAFKPRQVLLGQHFPRTTMTASASKGENSTKITLESKETLDNMILDYLHRNGFPRTLKRFQSEAQIQTDAWKAYSLHLEDMFCKCNPCDADSNRYTSNKPGNHEAMEKEKVCPANEEATTKKKKKKVTVESDGCDIKDQSVVAAKEINASSMNLGQIPNISVDELETQPTKKKTKHDFVFSTDVAINGLKLIDLTKKAKDKKKNIENTKFESSTKNEIVTEFAQEEKKKLSSDENGIIQPDVTKKEKKSSKKRKRPVSDADENGIIQPDATKKEKKSSKKRKRPVSDAEENENVSTETAISEELKRQKTETSKEEKSLKEEMNAQETSDKQFDGETNGKLEIDGVKSKKKQRSVTAETKTVNAFRRVKVDEIEFAHNKLQDNSYWAKDGAEIGYGAKAQEVLGQVRGRDFRHEKTKKKRGSYRGGLIDQQSHSIKFTYSDEE